MIFLSKKICVKNMLGLLVSAVGVGILLSVLVPLWGWLIVIGGSLIYVGWCFAERWFK